MGRPNLKSGIKYTYGDYLTWPDDERWEIIEGKAYNMSPAPGRFHQKYSGRLFVLFHQYLEDKSCEVYSAPFDVRLPKGKQNDSKIESVVQPDIVVVCDLSKLDEKGCKGAPDLIIEILSPSSLSIDHITKLYLYEKHGIKEYWVVHPIDKIIMIYLLNKNGKYERATIYKSNDKIKVSVLDGLMINLSYVFK